MKYEFYHTLPIHGISIKEVASQRISVNVTNASPNTDSTELLAVTNSTSINSQVVSC